MEDTRALAATGHLFLRACGVRAAAERLISVGVRKIGMKDSIAVLELRGGAHIVVRESESAEFGDAPFDLMYDDIEAAHPLFREQGFTVSDIEDGRMHRSFYATAPEHYRIQVLDSHAGSRSV